MAGWPPLKNNSLTLLLPGLYSQADPRIFVPAPVIALGDFVISKDGSAPATLGTTPTLIDGGPAVSVVLSSGEMNVDEAIIKWHDIDGQWCDGGLVIFTDTQQMSDLPAGSDYTAGRAANLDNIDAAITSRQPSGAVDLNADQSGVTVGTVNALAAAAITAAVVDTDAIDADALATDAVNEIRDAITAVLNDPTAAAIWSYATRTLTQAAASVTAAVTGSSVTVYRGTTWSIALTGLGDLSNYDSVIFSVKESVYQSENDAVLRVYNDGSGLLRINKAAPAAATNGSITIDDAANGDITITVNEAETQNIADGIIGTTLDYDVKGIDDDGNVDLVSIGLNKFIVQGEVTGAITSPS